MSIPMTPHILPLLALLLCVPNGTAAAGEFEDLSGSLRETISESRQRPAAAAEITPEPVREKAAHTQPPKDDLRAAVKKHLARMIAYCDRNMQDCNGTDNQIRNFAKTIGNGRCNNRGYNCVNGVLEMCESQLKSDEVTPMYYMACGAMLGKLGERDCAEGRGSCAGQLQGSLYFGLRAAAGCHKSFEKDKHRQAEADKMVERFAKAVNQDVKGVYVKHAEEASTVGHHLAWHAGKEAGIIGTEKVLEFAFERLAWHGAGAAVSAAGIPLFAFSTAMLFHEIAAAEMNNLVCLEWSHYYNGSYSNVSNSLNRMTRHIK